MIFFGKGNENQIGRFLYIIEPYHLESRRGHGYLSLVNVVCCQVDVFANDPSLAQRSPTECGVSECDLEISTVRLPRPA
jgi:hypothetical protein